MRPSRIKQVDPKSKDRVPVREEQKAVGRWRQRLSCANMSRGTPGATTRGGKGKEDCLHRARGDGAPRIPASGLLPSEL